MIELLIQNPLIPGHTENTYTKVTCETCDHWKKSGNILNSGHCVLMSGTENNPTEIDEIEFQLVIESKEIKDIVIGLDYIRTHKDFGCALYENKKEAKS